MEDLDVLVVGAGILGVASAYHILRNDPRKNVLLVDRYGAPGQGNTGRSNAMFRNTFSSRDNQTLSEASIDFYLHTQNEKKEDIGLEQIGYLWLMGGAQLSSSEPHLRGMERNGIEVRRLTPTELARLLPSLVPDGNGGGEASVMGMPRIEAGLFGPKCGRLDPEKLVRYYSRLYAGLGGKSAYATEAKRLMLGPRDPLGIEGEPFVWQESEVEGVELAGGIQRTVHPKQIVLACGAWGNELLAPIGIDGHTRAKKRQLFSVRSKGETLDRLLHAKGFNHLGVLPMVILPKSGVLFKPVADENAFWVGCEDDTREYVDAPVHDLDAYQAETEFYQRGIKPVLSGYFPPFEEAPIKAKWAGLYSYNTIDFLPFVFRDRNLVVVGGDSGSGIMKADSLGRIADAVIREEDEAILYGDVSYRVARLSFDERDVEREEWVI